MYSKNPILWRSECALDAITSTFIPLFLLSCSFVVSHYDEVERYFAVDPLLRAVFVALTPEAEFSLLCERMPPFLTASWVTKCILASKKVEKKEV